ncbi:aminotransferase class I/II-fold pyridoxal phosphate-dependent enzyme [Saccharothrix sp. AJ9571]|nr:aminotransferase class I/II-fold pyridoxal phosphate-dependent enzyme [Saccharothrix sp. AJ9571]
MNGPDGAPWLDLSAAELPEPLDAAADAVADLSSRIQRYPAITATDLSEALADRHQVPQTSVVLGAGSASVLVRLLSLLHTDEPRPVGDRREVVYAEPGFTAFPHIIRLSRGVPVAVPLAPDGSCDLSAMRAAVGSSTSAVIVANPHNPTGSVTPLARLREFGLRLPEPVRLVLDEAYSEFEPELIENAGERARWTSRTVVTRTFSKAYGLAGLRVGYALAHESIAARAASLAVPYEVSSAAVVAALASLAAPRQLQSQIQNVRSVREQMHAGMADLGVRYPVSGANFLWLPLREEAASFARHCRAFRLTVALFPGHGVRVTAGSRHGAERLLAAAASWANHRASTPTVGYVPGPRGGQS